MHRNLPMRNHRRIHRIRWSAGGRIAPFKQSIYEPLTHNRSLMLTEGNQADYES
jgi:hypothetical protein